jgi:hypothetical protein
MKDGDYSSLFTTAYSKKQQYHPSAEQKSFHDISIVKNCEATERSTDVLRGSR